MTEDNANRPTAMPGFKEQLKNAFSIAKNRFSAFFIIGAAGIASAAIVGKLWLILSAKLISTHSLAMVAILPIAGTLLMGVPIMLMFTAFFVAVVNQNVSAMEAYKKALPKFPGMLAVIIISELAINGGFFLLIIPGVILTVWFYFVGFIYVKEPVGVINSLVQSRECARGNFKLIFIRLLLIVLISFLCLLPLAALLFVPIAGIIIFALGVYLVAVLFFSFGYVLYEDISSVSNIPKAISMDKKQKAKSLLLALISIIVALGTAAWSIQNKLSELKKSPMNKAIKMAISGDMSDPENQKALEDIMNQQIQNMANNETNDMPPEMRAALKKMSSQTSTAANSLKKAQIEKKEVKQKNIKKPAVKPAEKLNDKQRNEKKIRDIFTEVLNDPDWRVRRDAANALGIMGWPEYIPELKRLTRDKNREVKNAAAMAIIGIHSTEYR